MDAGPSADAIPRQAVAEAWARQMHRATKRFALFTRDLRRSAPTRQRCIMRTVALAGGFGTLHILQ